MLTWSHYRFRQRFLHKIREYPSCQLIIVDEHYTSKTCGNCGKIYWKLGSNKTFNCPSCKVVMDRDIQAARNILLRFLTNYTVRNSKLALNANSRRGNPALLAINLDDPNCGNDSCTTILPEDVCIYYILYSNVRV